MSDRSFAELADAVETFSARVETYEELIDAHKDGRVSTERVERYIGDGLTDDSEGLVDAWMAAEDAAEELREYESDQEYGMDAPERPQRPDGPQRPTMPGRSGLEMDVERDQQAAELWQTFYDADQTVSEHESYALSEFDRSPVEYRMGIDAEYRDRMEDI
jgi:hypothetical protein